MKYLGLVIALSSLSLRSHGLDLNAGGLFNNLNAAASNALQVPQNIIGSLTSSLPHSSISSASVSTPFDVFGLGEAKLELIDTKLDLIGHKADIIDGKFHVAEAILDTKGSLVDTILGNSILPNPLNSGTIPAGPGPIPGLGLGTGIGASLGSLLDTKLGLKEDLINDSFTAASNTISAFANLLNPAEIIGDMAQLAGSATSGLYESFLNVLSILNPGNILSTVGDVVSNISLSNLFFSNSSLFDTTIPTKSYDYIVVGGGASGLIYAQTLHELKPAASILILERGLFRQSNIYSLYKRYVGIERTYSDISEGIITKQGLRSQIGRVLSGGSAINQGIVIAETDEYFDYLSSTYNVTIDKTRRDAAYTYVLNNTRPSSLHEDPYNDIMPLLNFAGFTPYNALTATPYLQKSHYWRTYSAFTTKEESSNPMYYGDRLASDNFLHLNQTTIDVQTNKTVFRIELSNTKNTQNQYSAKCVLYKNTPPLPSASRIFNFFNNPWNDTFDAAKSQTIIQLFSLVLDTFGISSLFRNENLLGNNSDMAFSLASGGDAVAPFVQDIANLKNDLIFTDEFLSIIKTNSSATQASSALWFSSKNSFRACLNSVDNGEIVLAAGALHTPSLLFKSRIGSVKDVKVATNTTPIIELPALGKNLHDRPLVPYGFFYKKGVLQSLDPTLPEPTSSDIAALGLFSNNDEVDCSLVTGFYDETGLCNNVMLEDSSFGHLPTGVLIGARHILPPNFRNTIEADIFFSLVKICDPTKPILDNSPLCTLFKLNEIFACMERAAGIGWFLSVPKSRGTLSLNSRNEILVDPNYFAHENDKSAAIISQKKLISMLRHLAAVDVNHRIERQTDQKSSSCPAVMYNHFFNIIQELVGMPFLKGYQNGFRSIGEEFRKMFLHYSTVDEGDPIFFPPLPAQTANDSELLQHAITYSASAWHFAGTAKMGDISDTTTAVNKENFLLHHTSNLVVVDASILPQLTRMNPVLTVQMMGRYIALSRHGS